MDGRAPGSPPDSDGVDRRFRASLARGAGANGAGAAVDSTGRGKRAGSRRRALKALSVVVGAAVAAAGSLVVIVDRHSDANAAVAAAANSALAGGSADVTLTGSGSAAGNTFSMTGTGSIDFAQGAMQMSVDLTEGAQQLSGQVIYQNKMIYVNLGSVINEIDAGKSWVSMSPGQLSSPGGASSLGSFNALSSDPAAALRALRQEGNAAAGRGGRTLRRFSQRGDGALHKPGSMD